MARMDIALHYSVELHDRKARFPGFFQAVSDQLFADVQAPAVPLHGIAGIGDMAAAADIVRVQDVQADDLLPSVLPCEDGCPQWVCSAKNALPV